MTDTAVHADGRRRWGILAIVGAAFFMTVLDVAIVNVALPTIKTSLHFSQPNLQWVITAYSLTFGGFLLLGGRIGDLLGRRRIFMIGTGLFTLASLTCGLAQNEAMLIVARGVQGLGAALISLGAELVPGAAYVLETVGFRERAARADLVVTGEGTVDRTSFDGKAPVEVARACAELGVRCLLFGGRVEDDVEALALSGDPTRAREDLEELGVRFGGA